MNKKQNITFTVFCLFSIAITESVAIDNPNSNVNGWQQNTNPDYIQSQNINPDKLKEFCDWSLSVPNNNWQPYAEYKSVIVIKDGVIIAEEYNKPESADFQSYLSSNGKAFAMMLFGILVKDSAEGKILYTINLNSKIYDKRWLPQGFPLSDPRKTEITFDMLFQHTSGLVPERTNTGEAVEQGRNNWTNYPNWVLGFDEKWKNTAKLLFTPGKPNEYEDSEGWGSHKGAYSSVGLCHIGLVIQNVYGKPAHEVLWERLLQPLGFSGVDYHAPPSEEHQWFSAGGLRITPRDYARFATFLLNDGKWNGKQLVPQGWVERFCTSPNYPNIRSNADGYFGEHYPKDMFRIAGSGLNWAYMIPSQNLVALRTGRSSNGMWNQVRDEFLEKLFTSLENQQD